MRVHYSTLQWFPPRLADVVELFSVQLARRGVQLSWYAKRKDAGPSEVFYLNGQPCRVPRKLSPDRGLIKVLNRVLYWAYDWIEAFGQLRHPPDVFIARDKFVGALGNLLAARLARRKFVYWMSYPFLEHHLARARALPAARRWAAQAALGLGWLLLYRVILPGADHVFVQSDAMKAREAEKGVPAAKMTPVPMGVKDVALHRAPGQAGACAAKSVAYLGTLARVRRLEILIDALCLVLARHPDAELVLVGDGNLSSERRALERHAEALGVARHVRFTGFLPMEDAWAEIAKAAVCVSPVCPDPILDVASPTKLVEYLALAKPVVVNDHPDQARVIAESQAGLCVPWSAAAFAEAIVRLLDDPQAACAMARRGPHWVRRHRSYGSIADQVYACLRQIAANSAAG